MWNMFCKIIIIVLLSNTINATVILTSSGPVRGQLVVNKTVSYTAYRGIPYAESPSGDLRFQPPVPKKKWTNILNATSEGPVCFQAEGAYKKEQMGEDCLNMNIYVPIKRTNIALLPVFVFIHGGGYKLFSKNPDVIYDPYFFVKEGILVVTMNYRLGALGFLSLKTKTASGNSGLKDVVLALQWIKENIQKFGGDSTKITLGGNSSGSSMVNYLLLTNRTTGLINQGLMLSGSALNFRFLQRYPVDNAIELATGLGLSTNNSNVLLEGLKMADPFDIISVQENMYKQSRNPIITFAPFVPVIEGDVPGAVIIEDPTNVAKKGIIQNIPILAGINSLEGITFYHKIVDNKTLRDNLKNNVDLTVPNDIEYPRDSKEFNDLVQSIKQKYFNNPNSTTLNQYFKILTDIGYAHKVDYFISLHKKNPLSNKLFYYELDFDGELNWGKLYHNVPYPGTCHADELGYLFVTNVTKQKLETLDERSQRTLDIVTLVMTNFIKYGNPTPSCNSYDVEWPESSCKRNHIVLKDYPELRDSAPHAERFAFWTEVYDQYYKYVQNGGRRQKILA